MAGAVKSEFRIMPGHLIRRAHQIAVAIFIEECAEHHLTPVQFACLAEIARCPGVDATRLASTVAVDRSTLGNVLERIEGRGWVERLPSPGDRRVKLLHITPAGRSLLEKVEASVEAAQRRMLDPLSPEDRSLFLRLLEQMVDGNNEASRAPVDVGPASE